ncbi:methyl-accepting chemotaxis protein [Natronincola ferrireducens]|uniref:Methyl-accepting chemotaxis protein (MCP) signalling domain-containing protein n=1 Tax=Natronincola ferrireducens TaxID=393762 RepID=A0A1G9HE41_9FIRM|nr:methyl-accepting chemotaxis protein [Natronincola ferrireducens]SDL10964.1 Methyl-accepting chemotaxis protein (MCP) signalling domain-containing protein [Natronincola ferrireducens]
MQHSSLEELKKYIPYFIQLVSADMNIGIYNKEICIGSFYTENFDLGVREGDKIPAGGATAEAIRTGEKIIKEIPKEVLGIPYIATSIPIIDEAGTVIGVITAAESIDKKEKLVDMANTLSSTMEEITATVEEITASTQQVADLGGNIENLSGKNLENVKQTDDVLKFVYTIAKQTKLLGLNASIEAARAGAAGSSFKIVAGEVSKLAESSAESTKKINDILQSIKTENTNMWDQSRNISYILQQLAASTQEISASIQSLSSIAEELLHLSQNIQAIEK